MGQVSNAQASSKRPTATVAVLMDGPDKILNRRLIAELTAAADERGAHLVFFFGGEFWRDGSASPASWAYSLPSSDAFSAILAIPHSIAPYDPVRKTAALLAQHSTMPAYSLLSPVPGAYSITSDESGAVSDMVEHLLQHHGFSRFALVCGHDGPESLAERRKRLVLHALKERGVTVAESMIFPGTSHGDDGRVAASAILRSDEDSPHALICLTSESALSATREFMDHGIAVPEDIAIVGFDDADEHTALTGAVSTVANPLQAMAADLIDRILDDLSNRPRFREGHRDMPARFHVRHSCGCTPGSASYDKEGAPNPVDAPRPQRADNLRNLLEESVEQSISQDNPEIFLAFLKRGLREFSRGGDPVGEFIGVFSTQWTISLLKHQDSKQQIFINTLFVDAFRSLDQARTNLFSRLRSFDRGSLVFYKGCNELLTQRIGLKGALTGIGKGLSEIGVDRCLIVFLDPSSPSVGELRLSYKRNHFTEIPDDNYARFPIKEIINTGVDSIPGPFGVLPLYQGGTLFGYIALSFPEYDFRHVSMIQDLVSRIIDSATSFDAIAHQMSALAAENTNLSKISNIDEFTGLANRRALYLTGRMRYDLALRNGEEAAFIFMDMDGLKRINDTWGHAEGDAAILALSNVLRESFREDDLVVRYGGDEFVILMTGVDASAVNRILERIESKLRDFNQGRAHPWNLAASWGCVLTNVTEALSFESIIEESDARLYEEKRKKRGQAGP